MLALQSIYILVILQIYVELERARLTKTLAMMTEQDGNISGLCVGNN